MVTVLILLGVAVLVVRPLGRLLRVVMIMAAGLVAAAFVITLTIVLLVALLTHGRLL